MDYAIVLYFDDNSDRFISGMMKNICNAGVNSYMLDVGIKPHITLAVFKEAKPENTSMWLRSYTCRLGSFKIEFSSIGLFPAGSSVLFLAPVINENFVNLHRIFNEQIKEFAASFDPFYLPGNWVPHCTLATRLSQQELQLALDTTIQKFEPFTAKVAQIGFIQCNPLREIITCNFNH